MSTKTKDEKSTHDEDHDLEHGDGHGHGDHHSHIKTYLIGAAILTAITVVEVASVEIDALSESMKVILILVTAIAKFAGVVAVFMHLQDDRNIFRILFVAPLVVAVAMIVVLINMSEPSYNYPLHEPDKLAIDRIGEKKWTSEEIQAIYQESANYDAGAAIFKANCVACHGPKGGGKTGPNLTDDCWKHGGDFKSIHHTLKNGVLAKGMPAWEAVLKDQGIIDVSLYIRSIQGSNPENAKACEGEKFVAPALKK